MVPTTLRARGAQLVLLNTLDDERTAAEGARAAAALDDEYARSGIDDPQILMTTSHEPTHRLLRFVKELCLLLPNAERFLRGAHGTKELVDVARRSGVTDLIVVHEVRGEPDGLIVCHMPSGPTAFFGLSGVVMRADVLAAGAEATTPEIAPHLVFENFSSKLGQRVQTILANLFPVPKISSTRVVSFINRDDYVSFR